MPANSRWDLIQAFKGSFITPSRLYMFRAMFSPIIRSTWLYLQHLVVFKQAVAGWWVLRFIFKYYYSKLDVHKSVHRDTTMKITNKMHYIDQFIIPSRLYMFRAMFSPIIRSTWLYLQYLVVFTQAAAGWQPAAALVNTTRYCKYSQVLLMMSENIARNMWSRLGIIN